MTNSKPQLAQNNKHVVHKSGLSGGSAGQLCWFWQSFFTSLGVSWLLAVSGASGRSALFHMYLILQKANASMFSWQWKDAVFPLQVDSCLNPICSTHESCDLQLVILHLVA